MKLKNRLRVCALICVLVCTTLIGCTSDEIKVLDAMLNAYTIQSYEANTQISLEFDTEGLTEDDFPELEMIKAMVNNSSAQLSQKMIRNEENTLNQQEIKGTVEYAGTSMDFGLWIDMDLTSEKPSFKEIIKMPLMMASVYGENKPYMFVDLFSMMDNDGTNNTSGSELSDMLKCSNDLNETLVGFIKSYAENFDSGMAIIKRLGSKTIEGVSLPKYRLEMSDKECKAFIRKMVNYTIENEHMHDLLNQMVESYFNNMASINPMYNQAIEALESPLIDSESLLLFKESFNEMMDLLEDVTILGDEGIVVDYVISKDGYIVYESGTIDIELNLSELEETFSDLDDNYISSELPNESKIQLKITYTSEITNINEDVSVEFPVLTDDNSFNIEDMLTNYNQPVEKDIIDDSRNINVYVNNNMVSFMDKPLIVNGRTVAPVREVIESINGEVNWEQETQSLAIYANNSTIMFTIGEQIAFVNGEPYRLEAPAKLINGRTYVPVRFIAESIGGEVSWDPSTSTVNITY